jgi:transcriptional regulator with XRE-family HTH domain
VTGRRTPTGRRFGDALRAARFASGASQNDVERSAGVVHSYLSRLESGQRWPSRAVVAAIVRALDVADQEAAALWHAAGYLTPEEWGEP